MVGRVLSGDIGGTKIRLAVWEIRGPRLTMIEDWTIESAEVSNLDGALAEVVRTRDVSGMFACFGVAGPVVRGKAQLTNLPWVVDSRNLTKKFGFAQTLVINDVQATAWAVPALDPCETHGVKTGCRDPHGAVVVVSIGTGFGQGGLVWGGESPIAFSGEGGHVDFAACTPVEHDLRRYLSQRYGHVSWERVLSGQGLVDVAGFFFDREGLSLEDWFEGQEGTEGRAAAVTSAGLSGRSEACVLALDLFSELLGSQAGNAALTVAATGGVYLAGGIPPKILPAILEGSFSARFVDKGRMRQMLEAVPVSVILNPDAPLSGAARCAVRMFQQTSP